MKPKYFKLFCSIFIPMALITASFLCFLTILFFYYKGEEQEKVFFERNNSIHNRMEKNADDFMSDLADGKAKATDAEYDNYLATTSFHMSMAEISAAFYMEENGVYTVAWDTDPKIYIILKNLNDNQLFFWKAEPSVLDQEVLDKIYEDAQSDESESFLNVELKDVYVKGQTFLPGKYELHMVNYNEDGREDRISIGQYEGVTDNPDGYQHIIVDGENWKTVFSPIILGTTNADTLKYLHEDEDRILKDQTVSDSIDYSSIGKRLYMCKQTVKYVAPTGKMTGMSDDYEIKEGVTISMLQIDLRKEYCGLMLTIYILSAVLVILISTAIAFYYYQIICEKVKREEYRREMTNALAHDLKSPLMVISGYAENLKDHVHEEKSDYYAISILDTVHYMNSIIDNILELAKLENKVIELDKKPIDLKSLTQELINRYEAVIKEKELTCELSGECSINADLCLMQRVLDNLIGNAVKYAPLKGKISIAMDSEIYLVENTGHIEEEALRHIKEPFVKGSKVRTGENGFGLGMTIVKNICELHGYKFFVSNEEDCVITKVQF